MGNLTVAVLGKLGYSSTLGKKGTSTDITLYNLKKGEDTVTFVEPTRYPDRLSPLFYTCSLAKKAIVVICYRRIKRHHRRNACYASVLWSK